MTLKTDDQTFAPPTTSHNTIAKYANPFGFSLQVIEAGQTIVLGKGGLQIAKVSSGLANNYEVNLICCTACYSFNSFSGRSVNRKLGRFEYSVYGYSFASSRSGSLRTALRRCYTYCRRRNRFVRNGRCRRKDKYWRCANICNSHKRTIKPPRYLRPSILRINILPLLQESIHSEVLRP